ncbi:hypothetical protein BBBOND_0107000 [Babesia bigemina]|uniref:Uncharacterized protein n=1 Tax=Babesia bigemina TaxID=5866 RepID=A0A061D0R3_BABBI|nr:hypothetical protein BBBOND_0107000 [Babesia bigemina]CDR94391.1 hypothetical protein BBBOND_0107000 [Babesia bigemina]|eukprot:XP_012766577.1 hypothetical protein BBBOND_0107000 [Babesia bigemina]
MEPQPSSGSTQQTYENPRKRRGIAFSQVSSSAVQHQLPPAAVLRNDERHGDISQLENTECYKGKQYTCSNKPVNDLRSDLQVHVNYPCHQVGITPSPTSDATIRIPARQPLSSTAHRKVLGPCGPLHRAVLQADSHNRALEKAEMWKRYRQSIKTVTPKKRDRDTLDRAQASP